MEPETKYVYRVRAINEQGLSEPSGPVNAQTPAGPGTARQSDTTDALLSSLTVSPVDIHRFDPHRLIYHVGVASRVTQVTITAMPTNSNASVTYDPATDADANAAGHQVDLSAGLNTVTLTVTAQDDVSIRTYIVHVGRGVTDAYGWKAEDDFNTLTAAGNTNPLGLWSDGVTVWVADSGDDKLYAYDMESKLPVPGRDFDALDAQNTNPTSLWSDGETMWVADNDLDNRFVNPKLFAYDMESKLPVPGRDFDTLIAAGNSNPSGLWSDGETMWVADSGDNKLYPYDMETKERVPGRDFDTLNAAGNDFPSGLWSDGVTMWVADFGDDKLYAYDLESKERVSGRDFDTLKAAGDEKPQGPLVRRRYHVGRRQGPCQGVRLQDAGVGQRRPAEHHRGRPGAGGLRPGRNRLLPPGRRGGHPGHRGGGGAPAAGRGHRRHASRRRPQRRRPPGGLPPE